jgi:hypothetical protein
MLRPQIVSLTLLLSISTALPLQADEDRTVKESFDRMRSFGQDHQEERWKRPGEPVRAEETVVVERAVREPRFSDQERRIIMDYFKRPDDAEDDVFEQGKGKSKGKNGAKHKGGKQKGLPPGLAKRDQLPPGLQKQLERNGSLPPGLAKRALPEDLDGQLSALPKGWQRSLVDNDVLLLDEETGVILDIIKDLF